MIVGTTLMAASQYILACLFMHAVFIYPNNHIFKVVTQPYAIKDVASLVYCVHNQFLRATWDIYDPGSMKSNRAMATVTQWSLSHDKPDCTDNTTTHKSHHVPLHVATFHKVQYIVTQQSPPTTIFKYTLNMTPSAAHCTTSQQIFPFKVLWYIPITTAPTIHHNSLGHPCMLKYCNYINNMTKSTINHNSTTTQS